MERKEVEKPHVDDGVQYRLLIDAVTDYGIYMLDPRGAVVSWNQGAQRFKGYAAGEIIGEHFSRFYTEADQAAGKPARALATALADGRFEDEGWRVRKDGTHFWASVVVDRVQDDDGVHIGFAKITRDITEKQAAKQIAKVNEQLMQAQKMEAVGQLTGGLAHDFNNILTGITGSLELMQRRVAQGRVGEIDRYLLAAQGAAKRAANLTHRLLAFSRKQTLEPKPTDLVRLVASMDDLIRSTLGPQVTVETVGSAGLWTTTVDQNQLENALLNLCLNARDAMPDGGRLTIETANRWLDETGARERDIRPGQYVSLCVSDTGSGMSPEVIQRAFDPFFTTKAIGMGSGLGLSMIYGFVRQSNGQVRIYSEAGQGTMVCIYLPRFNGLETESAAPMRAAVPPPTADPGEIILVVDDEPMIRMVICDHLQELGYGFIEAASGAEGLAILQSDARVDLLVSDIGLAGGMNGRQMAEAGKLIRPRLRPLFITGFAENAVIGNGIVPAGTTVLTKPFGLGQLARSIKTVMTTSV